MTGFGFVVVVGPTLLRATGASIFATLWENQSFEISFPLYSGK